MKPLFLDIRFHLNTRSSLVGSFIFFLLSFSTHAQNLVPNGSFEEYSFCPDGLGQLELSNGWYSPIGTCDFYHVCSPLIGVPENSEASQYAFNGSAYAGGISFVKNSPDTREIMVTQLTEEMSTGEIYYFSFRCCRAEKSTNQRACNRIGIQFFVELPQFDLDWITNSAHYSCDSVVQDTANWNLFSGSIVADQPFKYIAIGNFFNDDQTSSISFDDTYDLYAYYLYDDIRVSQDEEFGLAIDVVFTSETTIISNIVGSKLQLNLKDLSRVVVIDTSGKVVFNEVCTTDNSTIDISRINSGIYILQVFTNSYFPITYKFYKT
jgi:hypothetical protein